MFCVGYSRQVHGGSLKRFPGCSILLKLLSLVKLSVDIHWRLFRQIFDMAQSRTQVNISLDHLLVLDWLLDCFFGRWGSVFLDGGCMLLDIYRFFLFNWMPYSLRRIWLYHAGSGTDSWSLGAGFVLGAGESFAGGFLFFFILDCLFISEWCATIISH